MRIEKAETAFVIAHNERNSAFVVCSIRIFFAF